MLPLLFPPGSGTSRDLVGGLVLTGLFLLIPQTGCQGPGFSPPPPPVIASNTPKDCRREFQEYGEDANGGLRFGYKLACELRSINSDLDRTNLTVIPRDGTLALQIECSPAVNVQSRLLDRSFGHLKELLSLDIQYWKLTPSHAQYYNITLKTGSLEGLESLQNLTIKTFQDLQHTETGGQISSYGSSLTVEAGSLSKLTRLNQLDLSHSGVWSLPAGELCNLSALTHLNLSYNSLSDLSDLNLGTCDSNLGLLDLSGNRVRTLDSDILARMVHLKALNFSRNGINQVHDGALKGLKSLWSLDLSHNEIVALPASLFQDTPNLKQLMLHNNRLSVLSHRVFAPLGRLFVLDLSYNQLATPCLSCPEAPCTTCLSQRSFTGLTSLVLLNLAHNRIKYLHANIFQDLRNLKILDLTYNLMETIPEDSFNGVDNLLSLKVTNNAVKRLGAASLRGLQLLHTLDLSHNELERVAPSAMANLTRLEDLILFNNSLAEIPEAVGRLVNLRSVDVGMNGITTINKNVFSTLTGLTGLRLSENYLTRVEVDTFAKLSNLRHLNLVGNRINRVERRAFSNNTELQALRLDSNEINDIVGLFADLKNLRYLNISDNKIQKFDYFLLPPSLNWLDVHKNEIEDIGNYFDKESELNITTLDISFNKLKTISAKSIPDRVKILSLNDNQITRVDPMTFAKKSQLVRVDLYANQITKLETSSVSLPRRLDGSQERPDFYLGGNPFLCDCNLEWLKTINQASLGSEYPMVKDLESIYCQLHYSQDNVYIPLVDAKSNDFLCQYKAHCFELCHCCDFDACDCEMTCPDNCTCYHDQSWQTNIVDCAASDLTEPPTAIPMDATELYLHGNHFPILSSHSFIGRKKLKTLFLNGSNIEAVLNYTFYGLQLLQELHLEDNRIERLEGHEFNTLYGLKVLYLQYNLINYIEWNTFSHLKSLEILRLDNNRLVTFPGHFTLRQNPYLVEVTLAGNPWTCECHTVREFSAWLQEHRSRVPDASEVGCYRNNSGSISRYVVENLECSFTDTITSIQMGSLAQHLPVIIVLCSVLTVLAVGLGVLTYYRLEIKVWLFSHWGVRLCASGPVSDEGEKMYDAYVAYSIKDENFVSQVLSPELESGDPCHHLCLHYRDFPHNGSGNSYVADSIIDAVATSRRTIVILSKNFLIQEWTRYDVKSALHNVLREQKGRSIIIQMGDIPARDLDPDLRIALKSSVVIRWTDRMFWEKLRFFLPPGDSMGPPLHHMHAAQQHFPTAGVPLNGTMMAVNGNGNSAIQHYALPIYEVPHLPPLNGNILNGGGNNGTTTLQPVPTSQYQAMLNGNGINGTTATLLHNGGVHHNTAGLRQTHLTLAAGNGGLQQQKLYHNGGRTLDSHISAKIY